MANKITWFRNNLRIGDNEPLVRAIEAARAGGGLAIPVYVVDPFWFGKTSFGFEKIGRFRRKFLLECLTDLDHRLRNLGSRLWVFEGRTEEVLARIAAQTASDCVYTQQEYASHEKAIARRVVKSLRDAGVATQISGATTLVSEEQLPFSIANVPETFSRFRKAIERDFEAHQPLEKPDQVGSDDELSKALVTAGAIVELGSLDEFNELGSTLDARACLEFRGGEKQAWERLQAYIWDKDLLRTYKITRNGMLGGDYSSKFSPWLAHGCLSPRQVVHEVKRYEYERVANDSTYWLIFELLWRDYFAFMVAKHGSDVFRLGGLRNQRLHWSQNTDLFTRWCEGKTGFPIIDANMLELAFTGFMSNRGRQNVASFLTKNLGIDWRMGAEWFESLLVDHDPCSNYGNWNYAAGVGNDSRGFRWFNTLKQSRDYDPKGDYVRHWLPCLREVPHEFVHEPWKMNRLQQAEAGCILGADYPVPIVDLFKSARKNEDLYNKVQSLKKSVPSREQKRGKRTQRLP